MMDENIIGRNIRQLRKSRGMTLEQLAEKVGSTKSTISRYEVGAYEPSFKMIRKISEVFDICPARIYGFNCRGV